MSVLSTSNSSTPGTTDPASSDTTNINANPNPNGANQHEFEATLGEQFERFQQLLGRVFEGEDEEGPAPTTVPAPGSNSAPTSAPPDTATSSNTDAPQPTDSGPTPTTSARSSGAIGRDLGEGHAHDNDEDDDEDEVLARLTAGMSPQEARRLRATMSQMQNMFTGAMPLDAMFGLGPHNQARRDERDDDRDQFSGMYS